MKTYLWTGQSNCYDNDGKIISCRNSGQDGEFKPGVPWPRKRFTLEDGVVIDNLTGLRWLKNANPAEFPATWQEALDYISRMNSEKAEGIENWRLPNRRELRSLMAHEARKPALPPGHPFENVFLGWYWTSTTSAMHSGYAWYIHLEGARMFFGRKDQYYLFWPVSGQSNGVIPATGQKLCYDTDGGGIPCRNTGQDGELQTGVIWPDPRFIVEQSVVLDRLTGLYWLQDADVSSRTMDWAESLDFVKNFDLDLPESFSNWRLPTINELESLVDSSRHTPALPLNHPFQKVRDVYWSSTTSFFESDWAWALYLYKGATGVGFKKEKGFHLWPVASGLKQRSSF
jgi:Protein of unknown function (DUF1566)